jgi:outer membrane protein OmpA-like peptidoglycan-associated protein
MPINLGYPINTMDDDAFYCPLNDGKSALVPLTTHEGFGDIDIYRIDISESSFGDFGSQEFSGEKNDSTFFPCNLADLYDINERIDSSSIREVIKYDEVVENKTIPVEGSFQAKKITIKGRIILSDNNVVDTTFSIQVDDPNVLQTVTKVNPEVETGKYNFITNINEFTINAEGNGYEPMSMKIVIPDDYTANEMVVDIHMQAIQVASGEYFKIKSIFFEYGKFDLSRESQIELEKLFTLMEKNPTLYIEVIGHTDSWSSSTFNQKLSKKRARSAIDYLVNKEIVVERFVAKGEGELNPLAINANPDGTDNPDGRQFNRRVDMKILKTNTDNIVVEDVYIPDNLRNSGRPQTNKTYYYVLVVKQKAKYTKESTLEFVEHQYPFGYLYTTGKFEEKAEAVKLLNKAIDLEFNDARIISSIELSKVITGDKQIPSNNSANIVTNNNNVDTQNNDVSPNISGNDLTPIYAIQLKALSKPMDLNLFKGMKGVKEYLGNDGFYRYTYMEFSSREDAKKILSEIKEKGYNDAFVINVKRYKMRETEGNAEYTIQIKAMKTPLNMKYFNNIEGVKEIIAKDGYYKYIYGKYSKLDDAKKDLKKVKKRGYSDAFIVNVEKYN